MKQTSPGKRTHTSGEDRLASGYRRRTNLAAVIAVIALAGSTFVALPASAQEATPDTSSVEAALASAGVPIGEAGGRSLDAQALGSETRDKRSMASMSANGLTVQGNSESSTVTMMPIHNGKLAWGPSGTPVFGNTPDSAFALSSTEGNNAGYSVMFGQDAPKEYSYEFAVNGKPAELEATEDGGIEILNRRGDVVNLLAPPWAVDANGVDVDTEYVISKNIVTQIVRHDATNAFPVVADPRLRCDYLWCTVEATRAETAQIADHAISGSFLCLFVPSRGVPFCGAVVATAAIVANIARAQGKCIGYRVWARNLISWPHLAYISCYR